MKIKEIEIVNFKGIQNKKIKFSDNMDFLVSENNVGKTRILETIKSFYDKVKNTNIKIKYIIKDDEKEFLMAELSDNELQNEFIIELKEDGKHYYGDTNLGTKISKNLILGDYIYVPSVTNHEDGSNPGKPNTLRDLFNKVFSSEGFGEHLEAFNNNFQEFYTRFTENSEGQMSEINNSITISGFGVKIVKKQITSDLLIKNNFELKVDESGTIKDFSELGTGIQRNIVNAILCTKKNDKFLIYLYDEPETFLNPTAQKELIEKLYENNENSQFLIASHSPFCITRRCNIFDSLIRLKKTSDNNIEIFQYDDAKFKQEISDFNTQYTSDGTSGGDKLLEPDRNRSILKFWEIKRINALFETKILICEGATEELFLDLVVQEEKTIPYFNSLGKYKIPYYIILFKKILGIEVYAMFDKDEERNPIHSKYNLWIENHSTKFLKFSNAIEGELDYSVSGSGEEKLNKFLSKHFNNEITQKEEELKSKIINFWNDTIGD